MIRGSYFDARSARRTEAGLVATDDGQWRFIVGETELVLDPAQVRVSDRIGDVPRRLHLPDGAEFETPDNQGIDSLLRLPGARGGGRLVHALERRWGIALAALAAIVLLTAGALTYGLPAAAAWVAYRIPANVDRQIGREVLDLLDGNLFQPTRLPAHERRRVGQMFGRLVAGVDDGHDYRLELRAWRLGPNALALPSGIIIVTDDMVRLAGSDEELLAVLAHEMGHVRGRHALRNLIQSAGVSALALALLGDVGGITATVSAAGPMLVQMRYSRDAEREADAFARQWLQQRSIDPANFDAIMCRMSAAHGGRELPAFLSSHPPTGERARCAP
jgi:Zn-dependent protease with chaperone function